MVRGGYKTLAGAIAATAMLGAAGLASAQGGGDGTPIACTLSFSQPNPLSPVGVGSAIHYVGTVSVNAPYVIDHFTVEVHGGGTSGYQTVETAANVNSATAPVTFDWTWTSSDSNAMIRAHVYTGSGSTAACHVSESTIPLNDLPEVPWSAGLPLILAGGAVVAYRRRRSLPG